MIAVEKNHQRTVVKYVNNAHANSVSKFFFAARVERTRNHGNAVQSKNGLRCAIATTNVLTVKKKAKSNQTNLLSIVR